MRVIPIAKTVTTYAAHQLYEELGFESPFDVTYGDELAEFAGRNCYQSFHKPNPATRENKDYLAHILESAHESVLEHSSVTFFVDGVSRNLLLELERHRHISFSVISTRYVSPDKMGSVVHPNTPQDMIADVGFIYGVSRNVADAIYLRCRAEGMGVKEAREVARQVLPGNTETKIVVTGNIRAWRDILKKRYHPAADKEIYEFAKKVLEHLRVIVPNSVQDISWDS